MHLFLSLSQLYPQHFCSKIYFIFILLQIFKSPDMKYICNYNKSRILQFFFIEKYFIIDKFLIMTI